MRELDSIFNEKMLEFAINDFTKNTNFAINEIRVVEVALDELFTFVIIIAMNEHNDITLLNCEHATLFIYYVVNN